MTRFLRDHLLVIGASAFAAVFVFTGRVTPPAAIRAIDFRVLLVLFALLITVEILRASGYLDLVVERTVAQFHDTRPFAAVMILVSGARCGRPRRAPRSLRRRSPRADSSSQFS